MILSDINSTQTLFPTALHNNTVATDVVMNGIAGVGYYKVSLKKLLLSSCNQLANYSLKDYQYHNKLLNRTLLTFKK